MGNRFSILWTGTFLCFAAFYVAHGQNAVPTPSGQQVNSPSLQLDVTTQATLQSYQANQRTLAQSLRALIASGATPAQLATWQQQNGALLASQRNQAQLIAAQTAPKTLPTITDITIPNEASPELADLMLAKANLSNEDILSYNNQVQNSASAAANTPPVLTAARQAELQDIAQKVQAVAIQSASATVAVPEASALPPNTSPKLKAFLLARNELMLEELQLLNQYAASQPSVRAAAVQQWHQANANRFLQLQQLAQAMTQNPN